MADYWKSIPRKFCEFCKCWLTDNKPSIEFHERGRRHQENVKRKIGELRKQGRKEYTAQVKLNMQMNKINEAAMKAFQKDVVRDPVLINQFHSSSSSHSDAGPSNAHQTLMENYLEDRKVKQLVFPGKKNKSSFKKVKNWSESKDESGRKYYWNSETGESKWDPPAEGYISLYEQQLEEMAPVITSSLKKEKDDTKDTKISEDTKIKIETQGQWLPVKPSIKIEPVDKEELPVAQNVESTVEATDQWTAVTQTIKEEPCERIDLELPEQAPRRRSKKDAADAELNFKEKVIKKEEAQIQEIKKEPEVIFKKRKFNENKRNVRRRLDDD